MLTGDTLFIGDVGRPDLRASLGWSAEELGGLLYDSVHTKLLPLPDETLVYPAHGAGSLCGKNLSTDTVSTIGVQRRHNYALQPMSRDEFVRVVTADQPETPAYFSYDALFNAQERPTLEQELAEELTPLTLDEALALREGGAELLDARSSADFAGAHLVGSLNIGLDGSYATWGGTLLDHEQPIVIIVEPGREAEARIRLGRIGFDNVAGYLEDGMQALETRPELVERIERITATTLVERTRGSFASARARRSRRRGAAAVSGSTAACTSRSAGSRSGSASCPATGRSSFTARVVTARRSLRSILTRNGFDDVTDLVGGLDNPRALQAVGAVVD